MPITGTMFTFMTEYVKAHTLMVLQGGKKIDSCC